MRRSAGRGERGKRAIKERGAVPMPVVDAGFRIGANVGAGGGVGAIVAA